MTNSVFDALNSDCELAFGEEEFLRKWFFKVSIGNSAAWLRRSVSDVQRKAVFMGLLLQMDDVVDVIKNER